MPARTPALRRGRLHIPLILMSRRSPAMTQKPIRFEPTDRRIRVEFAGTIVADSAKAMLMCEPGHLPVYYLPFDDLRMDLMQRTNESTVCPHKGSAAYWNLTVDGR